MTYKLQTTVLLLVGDTVATRVVVRIAVVCHCGGANVLLQN
jgi:hypothetical protein